MSRDLIDQLEAYGRTLERKTGEPITGDRPPAPDVGLRRRWAVPIGVAASVVGLVAGLFWLAGRDGPEPTADTVPATEAPATPVPSVEPSTTTAATLPLLPLADAIGQDALGLTADGGWSLDERREEPLRRGTGTNCPDLLQLGELDGRPTIYERYSRIGPTDVKLDVTYIDAGTVDAAVLVVKDADERRGCDAPPARSSLPPTVSDLDVGGFRIGDEFALIAVRSSGNLAITLEVEGQLVTDELIADLIDRAATLLEQQPSVGPGEAVAPADVDFCVFYAELSGERPESYVGSQQHLDDIGSLSNVAPVDLQSDLQQLQDFLQDNVSPDRPESQMGDDWPVEIRAAIERIQTFVDDRC
ncbi:MAG: hypothetical protein ACR2HP_17865 [Ilumatobacteraceae bacterium]